MKSHDLLKRVREHVQALGAEIDVARASGEFRAWLECCGRFHRYSLHNTFLILIQKPDATRVAGYRAWQGLGRQVRQGEKSIRILAPCPCRKPVEGELDENGEPKTRTVTYFKVVSVFDVSQTDGESLPSLDTTAHGDDRGLLDGLRAVASDRGIAVIFREFSGSLHGRSHGGKVEIDTRLEPAGQAKTLIHELAHEALHQADDDQTGRSTREHEAEAVAYVVCRHFGIDGGSAKYLASWGADTDKLMERLENVHQAATGLIVDLEAKLTGSTASQAVAA